MEYRIENPEQISAIPVVKWNYEEIKQYALEKAEMYKSIAYTEGDVAAMKNDRADINRFIKAVESERIAKKKQYMAPYSVFEEQVKEVLQPLKDAEALIAKGLEEISNKWKEERKAEIRTLYDALIGDLGDVLPFEAVLDDSYFKKSTSLKKVEDSLSQYLDTVKDDMKEIDSLPEKYQATAIRAYKTGGRSLSAALAEVRRIQEEEKNIEERKRKDDELKAKAAAIHQDLVASLAEKEAEQTETVQTETTQSETEKEPILQLRFQVYGTREQILALRDYMISHNLKFERTV